MCEEGMDTQEKNKLGHELLLENFRRFEEKFKKEFSNKEFLKQEIKADWKVMLDNLSLKLCVMNISEFILPEKRNTRSISSDGIELIGDKVSGLDKAKEWYKETCKDKLVETIVIDKIRDSKDELAENYIALLVIVYDKNCSESFQFFVKVMLRFLKKVIIDLECLETLIKPEIWKDRVDKIDFDFIRWYCDKVFEVKALPEVEMITKIAFMNYENRPNNATMLFLDSNDLEELPKEEEGILKFDDINKEDMKFVVVKDNEKMVGTEKTIRKMLETCKGNERFLIVQANYPYYLWGIVTDTYYKNNIKSKEQYCCIDFLGNGSWKIRAKEDILLIYEKGRFSLDEEQKMLDLENEVKKIKGLNSEEQISFVRIIDRLYKQNHGALMIIAKDAKIEAERLCKRYKRGTLVEEINLTSEENWKMLDGIASIDGAVMVDLKGICYGFGIILDGVAKRVGDLGKGSRFNSAVNYIADKERYAIIVSEDKQKHPTVECGIEENTKGE